MNRRLQTTNIHNAPLPLKHPRMPGGDDMDTDNGYDLCDTRDCCISNKIHVFPIDDEVTNGHVVRDHILQGHVVEGW